MNKKSKNQTTSQGIDSQLDDGSTAQFLAECAIRAEEGGKEGVDAALELLRSAISELEPLETPALTWLRDKLHQIVFDGIHAERALCLESDKKIGRPPKCDRYQLIAVDILLRDYANFSQKEAAEIIEDRFDINPRTLRDYRTELDSRFNKDLVGGMEKSSHRILISSAGDYLLEISDLLGEEE